MKELFGIIVMIIVFGILIVISKENNSLNKEIDQEIKRINEEYEQFRKEHKNYDYREVI